MAGGEEHESSEDVILEHAFEIDVKDVGEYKPDEMPVNGHQYLHRVMKEAETLPGVVVAEINRNKFNAKQTVYIPKEITYEIPEQYLPTEEWQIRQVEDFEDVRVTVSRLRPKHQDVSTFKIPKRGDSESEWFDFIWKSDWNEPPLQLMLAFDQATLDDVSQFFINWLEEGSISFNSTVCFWIYSLLACLEIPLLPSTFSVLRTLTQLAIKYRARLTQQEEAPDERSITQLNLLICIVGRYFKQTDLADKY